MSKANAPREIPLASDIEVVYGSKAETFDTIVETLDKNTPSLSENAPSILEISSPYRAPALEAPDTKAFYAIVKSMIEELGISHVGVVAPATFGSRPSEKTMPGPTSPNAGIAGFDVRFIDSHVYVSSISPGSGAEGSSLRQGMEILKIGDFLVEDIVDVAQSQPKKERAIFVRETALRASRGPEGDMLSILTLTPDGNQQAISIELGHWNGKTLKFGHVLLSGEVTSRDLSEDIGYVHLSVFSFELMADLQRAFRHFHNKKGLILDLRGNLGGIAGMSQAVAGYLTDAPFSLGETIGPNMTLDYVVFPRPAPFTGQLVILLDDLSASTSEILAAGLKGVGRAKIVGSQSAGMVLPSMVIRLPDGGLLQYATALYITPTGEVLEGKGVTPDVKIIPSPSAWLQGQDPALNAAIEQIMSNN